MPRLILIRHGQSQWNLENRFTGWWDVDVTEKGAAIDSFYVTDPGRKKITDPVRQKEVERRLLAAVANVAAG